jgi:two-component system nitrate/nitrite response regulator NarL
LSNALKVVLADLDVVFIEALAIVLAREGHRVVAAAATRGALIDGIREFEPDVCVTDNAFPDGAVLDVIEQLVPISPRTRIVMLTADGDAATLRQALDAGAAGYVHKSRGLAVLIDALQRVVNDEIVVGASFARRRTDDDNAPLQRLATYLTHREAECLTLLAEGLDTTAMARRLGVSRTTVRSHVQAVLTKLGAHSRLEAASMAIRFGLVERPAQRHADINGGHDRLSCSATPCAHPSTHAAIQPAWVTRVSPNSPTRG